MATFPSITPTYGQQKSSAPLTRTVRFADGYEHRILFGLAQHQNPKEFNFTFEVSETDADTIEGFLDSRANDSASFTFTPPGEGFTKTGTYSQSGTTVTITITSHGVAVGDELTIDYTSGSATDGTFLVASVTDSNVSPGLTKSGRLTPSIFLSMVSDMFLLFLINSHLHEIRGRVEWITPRFTPVVRSLA